MFAGKFTTVKAFSYHGIALNSARRLPTNTSKRMHVTVGSCARAATHKGFTFAERLGRHLTAGSHRR